VAAFLSEDTLIAAVDVLVRIVEVAGAVVIFAGAILGFGRFLWTAFRRGEPQAFIPIRLNLGRYLALGLEFQLASDILRTAIAPTFQEIGELAAVAAIRTALNYFLSREIREEREEIQHEHAVLQDQKP
jgi:uncharacterized membrane protein